LDLAADNLAQLERYLTPGERARALRFLLPRLCSRFVTGRALMRWLLGCYLNVRPEEVVIAYGANGKPHLSNVGSCVEFNLTHSQGSALLAIAQHPVGIDLEVGGCGSEMETIAASFFAPEERAAFAASPPHLRLREFRRIWVRKEAYMKATGRGIRETPSGFAVVPDGAGLVARPASREKIKDGLGWQVYDLESDRNGAAALAARAANGRTITRFELATCPNLPVCLTEPYKP
jgi:4'-phosphopantetheinyl transferase